MTLPPAGRPDMAEALGKMLGVPSPEKVLGEIQRLNHNLEMLQPDIHLLAQAMQSISGNDIRNLSAALSNMKAGEFINLGNQIYEKLWGKK